MKCKECGAELKKSAKFCPKCGAKAEKKKAGKRILTVVIVVAIIVGALGFAFLKLPDLLGGSGGTRTLQAMTNRKGDNDAFAAYEAAIKKTVASGSWTEKMNMTSDVTVKDDEEESQAKTTVESTMNITGWKEDDISDLYISGSLTASLPGQTVDCTVTWKDGTAHYEYTKPAETSMDVKVDPAYFNLSAFQESMISSPKKSGDTVSFTVSGEDLTKAGISLVDEMLENVENLKYGDAMITADIDKDTGKISNVKMSFHASMQYQGYDAEADYDIQCAYSDYTAEKETAASGKESAAPETVKATSAPTATVLSAKTEAPFYGVWIAASKTETEAQNMADQYRADGLETQIVVTTDWSNLNNEKYYTLTAGAYATQDEAEARLSEVKAQGLKDAYVKYTGEHK